VLPAKSPVAEQVPSPAVLPARKRRRAFARVLWNAIAALVGWAWRLLVGAWLCFNAGLFNNVDNPVVLTGLVIFTSIVVVGWTYRRMQGVVLRGWWKQSRFRAEGSFEEFCSMLGPRAPVARPRWFLMERIGMVLRQPGRGAVPAGPVRLLGRLVRIPWASLWLNFKIGLKGLFCTYLLLGWGCVMMWQSWVLGWINSFNKGYEQAFLGPLMGVVGSLLLIAGLFYVPMAQVHQAATGQARAFFDFSIVWRLIRARLTAYVGLAALLVLASAVFEGLRLVTTSEDFPGNAAATDIEGLEYLQTYWFRCSLAFFPLLVLLRTLTAVIYRSAVLKTLRQGSITRQELHPVLAGWLERLDLRIIPRAAPTGVGWLARLTGRWAYRRVLFVPLFLIWLLFVVHIYVGDFFHADDFVRFMNQPFLQFPSLDYVPTDLWAAAHTQS
jgi:hypothetical protein